MNENLYEKYIKYISKNFDTNTSYKLFLFKGILKAVQGNQPSEFNRITKDVVAFYAGDFPDLVEKLQLDLHEPPISQVNIFLYHIINYIYKIKMLLFRLIIIISKASPQ